MSEQHNKPPMKNVTQQVDDAFAQGAYKVAFHYSHGKSPAGRDAIYIKLEAIMNFEQDVQASFESIDVDNPSQVLAAQTMKEGSYSILMNREEFEQIKQLGYLQALDQYVERTNLRNQ